MNRRRFLRVAGTLAACGIVAGCGGDESVQIPPVNHEFGEPFVVTSGTKSLGYVIEPSGGVVDSLDPENPSEEFIIFNFEVENASDEPVDIVPELYNAVTDKNQLLSVDMTATTGLDSPLLFGELNPYETMEGQVAFETPPSPQHAYVVLIRPKGQFTGADTHALERYVVTSAVSVRSH